MKTNLTFEYHLSLNQAAVRPSNQEDQLKAEIEAGYDQALFVSDALLIASNRLLELNNNLQSKDAGYYLRFGAIRRIMMIHRALKRVIWIVQPDRSKPLSHDETNDLSIDLNAIYMNLRGSLDNLAWTVMHEKNPDFAKGLTREKFTNVNIFSKKIFGSACDKFVSSVSAYNDWGNDLRNKRDPVAHRIPLVVPPAFLSPSEDAEYQRLSGEFQTDSNSAKSASAEKNQSAMEKLGVFIPYFMHHPSDPLMPIFPTVSNDIVNLMSIADLVSEFLTVRDD